jgi:hypothetical protein
MNFGPVPGGWRSTGEGVELRGGSRRIRFYSAVFVTTQAVPEKYSARTEIALRS